MKQATKPEVDLFDTNIPEPDQIRQLGEFVHSSEAEMEAFRDEVMSKNPSPQTKTALAKGIGLYILGMYREAIEQLENSPDSDEKFHYLALSNCQMGRYEQAISNLEARTGAGAVDVSLEKAAVYTRARNFEAAQKQLADCADSPSHAAAYLYRLGRLQEAQGLYSEAMDSYSKSIEQNGDCTRAVFRLAYLKDLTGDEESALQLYTRIISGSPTYISALINLAVLYEDKADYDKAAQCVEAVLHRYPNHQRAILFIKDIESSKTMFYDEEKEKKKDRRTQILDTPITDFELSVRSRNCFEKMDIKTIGDLLHITEAELLSYKNFGETSLKEIKALLDARHLRLGMAIDDGEQPRRFTPTSDDQLPDEEILNKPVTELQLPGRARKCVEGLHLQTIGDLIKKSEAELLGFKNFGNTSLVELKKALKSLGVSLRAVD